MIHIAASSQALFVILHLLLFPSTWASLNHAGLVSSAQGVRLSRAPLNYYKSSKTWKLQEIPSRWIPLLEWFYGLLLPSVLSQASVFKSRMDKMEVWATAWQQATEQIKSLSRISEVTRCSRTTHARGALTRGEEFHGIRQNPRTCSHEPPDLLHRTISACGKVIHRASQVEREAEANHLCHGAG